jgi:hypothetical protein
MTLKWRKRSDRVAGESNASLGDGKGRIFCQVLKVGWIRNSDIFDHKNITKCMILSLKMGNIPPVILRFKDGTMMMHQWSRSATWFIGSQHE